MNEIAIAKLLLAGLTVVTILGALFGRFLGKTDKKAVRTTKN